MQEKLSRIDGLLTKGSIKKAEVLIARVLRSHLTTSEQAELLLRRARTRLLSARSEDALDDLSLAHELLGEGFLTPENLELLGDCCFASFELASVGFADRSFLNRAQQTYEEIVRLFPRYGNLGWIHYQLGRVAMANSQIEKAVDGFQQALLSPSHISTLTAYCYERLGFIAFYEWRDLDQALGFLNRAVDTYPTAENRIWLVQVHLRRSRVMRQMHNFAAALKAAETALGLVPGGGSESKHALAETQLTIAELLSSISGRDREVVNCLQQFTQNAKTPLGVDVTWSRAHELLGDAHFNLGQYDSAVSSYRAALQYNPDHPWELSLLYRIARSYYHQRSYHETLDVVQNILDVARMDEETIGDYRVYDILGSAQFALGNYEQAARAYRRALELAPSSVDTDRIKTYLGYASERI